MQRYLTFTFMRWGFHPARAGILAMITPWVIIALTVLVTAVAISVR